MTEVKLKYDKDGVQLYWGNSAKLALKLPEKSVQAVVTSPTYWGKRSFTDDPLEFGSEPLEEYVARNLFLYEMILGRLLKDDGSLFVIIQDTYMGSGGSRAHHTHPENLKSKSAGFMRNGWNKDGQGNVSSVTAHHDVIQNKSLCGIPFRIAIALVDKGYIWRQNIIWDKPNPQPEPSADDRAWQSAEYVLHFTKNGAYKFNKKNFATYSKEGKERMPNQVWTIAPKAKEKHTATFPVELVEKLMLAVTNEGDAVFEPFLGSGTMLELATSHGRKFVGCDICESFVDDAVRSLKNRITRYF